MTNQQTAQIQASIQIASMFSHIKWPKSVKVEWVDSHTAYTNGLDTIWMPKRFMGIDLLSEPLSNNAKLVIEGLIAHEFCHFLQPMRVIAEVLAKTGFNKGIANVIMDIQGERVIERLFPQYKPALRFLRKMVRDFSAKVWEEDLNQIRNMIDNKTIGSPDAFIKEVSPLTMMMRFGRPTYAMTKSFAKHSVTNRGGSYGYYGIGSTPRSARQLPTFIQRMAEAYPELCSQDLMPSDGQTTADEILDTLSQILSGQGDQDGESGKAKEWGEIPEKLGKMIDNAMSTEVLSGEAAIVRPPLTEAIDLAERICVKLGDDEDDSSLKIAAPVNIIRRKLALKDPMPWEMPLENGNSSGVGISIAIDYSGSMFDLIDKVRVSAQAIALAMRRMGVKVTAVQFGSDVYASAKDDDSAIFTDYKDRGNTNTGAAVNYLWSLRENDVVIVITDGDGSIPYKVSKRDHARTHVIMLPGYNNKWAASQIGTPHMCKDLKDLPEILTEISKLAM